jgi:hypothetical protein
VPQNKPFPDMTLDEERAILQAIFNVADRIGTIHLTGGGEPFLHPQLAEMIDVACEYADKFNRLMLFTNCTVKPSEKLLDTIARHKDKIIVQISRYGVNPEHEPEVISDLKTTGAVLKVEKYYGENQSFGGWVDFGAWAARNRTSVEREGVFRECSVTRVLKGNWRTRDGKVHWCSRSQRGMELGLLPDNPVDYVDLFDSISAAEKRAKFEQIANANFISACDHCSGDAGTIDSAKRFDAAEQM